MDFKKILSKLGEYGDRFNQESQLMNSEVAPEDEAVFRENLRNTAVNKLGLPQDWRQSLADEKRYIKEAPMAMAMGGLGSVGKAAGKAAQFGATKVLPSLEQTLAQKGLGKVLSGVGQEMKQVGAAEVKAAAQQSPEMIKLMKDKLSMSPGAYDQQKQQIFNKIRETLMGSK